LEEDKPEMSQEIPNILIAPEAQALLAAEVERGQAGRELTGGLLFGHPLDAGQRLVVSSVRLSDDVGFGRGDFSLDQTRTSRQLDQAQQLDPQANYCGVWYIHRTPNRDLVDEEWRQAQVMLEDPDFRFEDLVCIVLSYYYGKLNIYASSLSRLQAARGQAPTPTELRLTTDWLAGSEASSLKPDPPPTDWYKAPEIATRLAKERQRLGAKFRVEPALTPDGQMYLRLSPRQRFPNMSFYMALNHGFPDKAPHVFLLIGGKPHRLSSPLLGGWGANRWLVELADELVQWLAFSTNEYLEAAQKALQRGSEREAADLLRLVLAIEPRTPGAARLLARAEGHLTSPK
jgi:hypothetical protein